MHFTNVKVGKEEEVGSCAAKGSIQTHLIKVPLKSCAPHTKMHRELSSIREKAELLSKVVVLLLYLLYRDSQFIHHTWFPSRLLSGLKTFSAPFVSTEYVCLFGPISAPELITLLLLHLQG